MTIKPGFQIRSMTKEDLSFIQSSWGSSYYSGNPSHKFLVPGEFHAFHRPIREQLLSDPHIEIKIYCPEEDPWHIMGWILYRKLVSEHGCRFILHYLYVKEPFRHEGIGFELLSTCTSHNDLVITHQTQKSSDLLKSSKTLQGLKVKFHFIPHLI